ncbi:MAG TPA: hypothetical protein PKY50_13210 [Candidatus Competibacter sp.]|nr:hypothetical protein [Candidatus Competibacter sp.]
MILQAAIIGVGAATLLLVAGYLFGVQRGYGAREHLRRQSAQQAVEMERLHALLMRGEQADTSVQTLKMEMEKMEAKMEKMKTGLEKTIEPVLHQGDVMQRLLQPLVRRERLSAALSELQAGGSHSSDLLRLIDQITEKGNFVTVVLCDAAGFPLAASSNAQEQDNKLALVSSVSLMLADRMERSNLPEPLAMMIHDATNTLTLCRFFRVGEQELVLTATSTDTQLVPTALDPALAKLETVLTKG